MSWPLLALRAAIREVCLADTALAVLMGGDVRFYDDPPRGAPPIYALFGDTTVRDLSTSSERGHEQEIEITVWASAGSTASAAQAADRMGAILDDAPLEPLGHRLVHLSLSAIETRRDPQTNLARVTLHLRAVTEADA